MPVKIGDTVKIEFESFPENGATVDNAEKPVKPLKLVIGDERVPEGLEGLIEGLEEALIGMEKGEEKKIKLRLNDWYGDYNPQLIKKIPRNKLLKEQELRPGMILKMTVGLKLLNERPWEQVARIIEVTSETVTIDLNTSLAGKILNFKIKVVDIAS
ncbi:MAG: FKBP-type peptidyl-prolyl cis-trans isomerase [Candidatus Hodarchaeales archaeon]|jgi:peptidylprolyl isomerase